MKSFELLILRDLNVLLLNHSYVPQSDPNAIFYLREAVVICELIIGPGARLRCVGKREVGIVCAIWQITYTQCQSMPRMAALGELETVLAREFRWYRVYPQSRGRKPCQYTKGRCRACAKCRCKW